MASVVFALSVIEAGEQSKVSLPRVKLLRPEKFTAKGKLFKQVL